MPKAGPIAPFYLIVTEQDRGVFSVEGPMTDDRPWGAAAQYARNHQHRITGRTAPTETRWRPRIEASTHSLPASRPAAL
jgi:hypothetical protein